MKQEFLAHRFAYVILILGLGLLMMAFLGFWPNRFYQRLVVVGLMFFYTSWGTVTHLHADHITKRIVYEYLSISLLAGSLLFLVTV